MRLAIILVMEITLMKQPVTSAQLYENVSEKEEVADILQNDISQTLAAVLLWMQTAMADENLANNLHLQLAESNLKESVKKLVRLHYALLK